MAKKVFIKGTSPLFLIVSIIIAVIIFPSIMIMLRLFEPATESWLHIQQYLLKDYIKNTLFLVIAVGGVTSVIGTYFGWALAKYKWKFGRILDVALFLPIAIPPYIGGYIYGGIFTPFGTLDRIFYNFGLAPIRIDILSMGGAVFVFSLFLMPYVILVTRAFFERLPENIEESSRLLGKSRLETFKSVILPMSRGAIVGGTTLVVLEVLNDYGLVKYFGIPTFSTAIYKTWFGLSDVDGAVRLAANLMIIVVAILLIEHFLRGRGRLSQARAVSDLGSKKEASSLFKVIFSMICGIYVTLSLAVPVSQLTFWALIAKKSSAFRDYDQIFINTIALALVVTIFVVISGILIGNLNRFHSSTISKIYSRIVVVGYSIPASIIAVAVLVFFISIDRGLADLYQAFGLKNLFLTSSLLILIFALFIRFMAIGFNNIEAGLSKIGKKYYEASKVLGKGELKTFAQVDLPMLKPAIISASILTFVDVLKELPLTLILRPFNFETLATSVYNYAGDEMIHEASIYALMIIGTSAIAIILLTILKGERRK